MKEHFDLIALPKGQAPGGPVQASDGTWYIVIPAMMDVAEAFRWYRDMRKGRVVTDMEIRALREELAGAEQFAKEG